MFFLSTVTVGIITHNDNTLPLVITRNSMKVSGHLRDML